VQPVSWKLDGDVAWIEFGDPAAANLLDLPLLEALPLALKAAEDQARVAVLRGRGGTWSSGYAIDKIPAELFDTDPAVVHAHPFERCMRAVADCRVPTLAALEGHAIGGALELAAACDLRLATAGARFGITAARLGLVYPFAGLERFWQLLGPATVRRLLFTGELVDTSEAERIGLVHAVVPHEAFDANLDTWARRIASCAPLAVQGMKATLRLFERAPMVSDATMRRMLALRHDAYRSDDFREGCDAFATKREPRFRGR